MKAKLTYIVCAGLLGLAFPSAGVDYHVAKTGSDANPGSAEQPWLTVGNALETMVGGDMTLIGPGVYNETVSTVRSGSEGKSIIVDGQGVATLAGFQNHAPIHPPTDLSMDLE